MNTADRNLRILVDLNRQVRRVRLLLASLPEYKAKPYTAAYRWEQRMRRPMEGELDRLLKRIKKRRRKAGMPVQKLYRVRPSTPADKRIARQYSDVAATRKMF